MITSCANLIRGYSKAIFAIANKLNSNEEYLKLLEILHEVIQNSKVKIFIKDNLLHYQDKSNFLINLISDKLVLNKIFNAEQDQFKGLNTFFQNFIKLLAINNHLLLLPRIYDTYENLYLISTDSLKVNIITAIPLESALKGSLKENLTKYLKKRLLLNYNIDKSIIGGLIVKHRDQVIDFSLKGKLLELKRTLIND